MKYIPMILFLALGGCVTDGTVTGTKPICDALLGPIRYTSTNKASLRFAGKTLVVDLKMRNQVGQRLNCPGFQ